MIRRELLVVACFAAVLPLGAVTNGFTNGSFEANTCSVPSGSFVNLARGSACISGWTIGDGTMDSGSGNIDLITSGYWQAAPGTLSIDLDGLNPGSISQTFSTTPGTTYAVTFALSGNPHVPTVSPVKTLLVTGPGASTVYTYNTSTARNTTANMMYVSETFSFTASGASSTVTFASEDASSSADGPVINNVNISAPTPQILSQFVFGGGWYSALYFTNTSAGAVSFSVAFTSDNGTPLTVPSIGSSSATVTLAPQATTILEAPDAGSLTQGYATASLPSGVTGYAVFRQSVPGMADQEAVVPLASTSSTASTLIWDDTNFTTSVAIANPSAVPVTVSITLWNSSGSVVGTSSVQLGAGAKTEAELRDLPGLGSMVGQRGSAKFSVSSGDVAVLGLRFNGAAFTSIPAAQQ